MGLPILVGLLLLRVAFAAHDCERDVLGTCTIRRYCDDGDVISGRKTCSKPEYGLSEVCCAKVPNGISVCNRRGGTCLEYCNERVRIPGVICGDRAMPACCILVI